MSVNWGERERERDLLLDSAVFISSVNKKFNSVNYRMYLSATINSTSSFQAIGCAQFQQRLFLIGLRQVLDFNK